MAENDHNLIQGLVAGHEESYNTLYNEYYLVLTVFAKNYLGDIDLAREVVQDMFVRLYESRDLLKAVDSIKAYLYKSIKNSCLNYIKSNKIHNKHKENIRIELSRTGYDILEDIEKSELEHRIFQIVSELPEKCQQIFRMSRVDGLKNEEIAREFNISKRTVETQISKALKKLRIELAPFLTILALVLAYVFMLSYLSHINP